MKKTASKGAAGCRMDGAQDAKKEILVDIPAHLAAAGIVLYSVQRRRAPAERDTDRRIAK
jgi:hypothetical protein